MSNILPTVGRTVQYLDSSADPTAAIITHVNPNGTVDLTVFYRGGAVGFKESVNPFIVGARASANVNCYQINWQGR